ncbi:Acyl-protein thioesterase 2 [Elasticomyces elasticus]|nr:Acyl-protein thioesterase 2 [Elasticomyces elasticus]
MPAREDPIFKPATSPTSTPAHSAAFIFLHGLGDSASGWDNIADQFQRAQKLPYMQWIFPNALENHDAMQTAWFTPTSLSAFAPSRPELEDEEDEAGLRDSVSYVESLIDKLASKGVPLNRIVLGGFSQGCALSLLTSLTSEKYAGKLAGIVGLSGYLPLAGQIQHMRSQVGLPAEVGHVPMFLVRGGKDMLVPRRVWNICLSGLKAVGVEEEAMEVHEYERLGHTVNAEELRDLCAWLERVVPKLED